MLINILSKSLFRVFIPIERRIILKMSTNENNDNIRLIKEFVPKLTEDLHKGQCGRIGVIGGSLEYTGAPYFAAISALKLGADLVHVFCCKEAATVIKGYSPELIVHPVLDDDNALSKIMPWLERLHVLLVGPGMGRESGILKTVESVIHFCNQQPAPIIPLVIDADGLFLVTNKTDLITTYRGPVILTPNAAEYQRLSDKLNTRDPSAMAQQLGAVVLKKGAVDIIANGLSSGKLALPAKHILLSCDSAGCLRRCGGQGDILSGCVAVFTAWYYMLKYVKTSASFEIKTPELSEKEALDIYENQYKGFGLAAYGACVMLRMCSSLAFAKYGRSMTASDLIPFLHDAFNSHFEHRTDS